MQKKVPAPGIAPLLRLSALLGLALVKIGSSLTGRLDGDAIARPPRLQRELRLKNGIPWIRHLKHRCASPSRIAPAMGPVSAEIEIDAPRERAFAAISDLARRPSFTDHFISELRLTRIESRGVGAGARFRITTAPRGVWMDTAIVEAEEPTRLVERGRGGRGNRIPSTTVWELLEGPGSLITARVSFWTEPSNPLDRLIDALGGAAMWQERAWGRALERLRDQLESEEAARPTVGVAGGNPHATGIP
jgi:hypothetical protein